MRAFMALRNQEIGARLRELRGEKPQTTVADELGVSERTYQNWEAGDAKPSYRNLQRLAEYYGVTEEYILTGTPLMQPLSDVTPTPFAGQDALAGILARLETVLDRIDAQLDEQTEVLREIKGLLGKDAETADRIEVASGSLGGTAQQLDAAVAEVIRGLQAAPPQRPAAKRKTAPKRTQRA